MQNTTYRNERGSGAADDQNRALAGVAMPEDAAAANKSKEITELTVFNKVPFLSLTLFSSPFLNLTILTVHSNSLCTLPAEICKLQSLEKLDASNNLIVSLPPELGKCEQLRTLNLENNQLSVVPYELGKLYNIQEFNFNNNPLSYEFSSIYHGVQSTPQFQVELLNQCREFHFVPPPPPRMMISISSPRDPRKKFSVLSYNILSQHLVRKELYNWCPYWALGWETRRMKLINEIISHNADIVCLQEVEWSEYNKFFYPFLHSIGYKSCFSPKSRVKTMTSEHERERVDGCAIFYKVSKFVMIKEEVIEFNKLAIENAGGSQDMINRVMVRDNIAIAAVLYTVEENGEVPQPLIVCNVHIHWDPENCDVKVVQSMMLISELNRLKESVKSNYEYGIAEDVHVILAGDFNSLPNSAVFAYIEHGSIPQNHGDFMKFLYKDALYNFTAICDTKNDFSHSMNLESSYKRDYMPFTNYTYKFQGMIDYIFYSKNTMKVLSVLQGIAMYWFQQNSIPGCPNTHIPSDHFSLYSELEMQRVAFPIPNGLHHPHRC